MSNLYQREELLVHMKEPLNRKVIKEPTHKVNMVNRACGDELDIYLKTDKKGVITDVGYFGEACGVAIASASMFSESLKGKTFDEVKKLTNQDVLENFNNQLTTSRIPCALLIYDGVKKICRKKQ